MRMDDKVDDVFLYRRLISVFGILEKNCSAALLIEKCKVPA